MTTMATTAGAGRSRRGMTLVELLVVVGLLAGFMALVIAGVRNGQPAPVRRGAEQLAAALTSAQARSLGGPEGAGTIVTLVSGSTAVYDAVMQPLIEATVTGVPPSDPSLTSVLGSFTLTNAENVSRAYKILLTGTGGPGVGSTTWMAFSPSGPLSGNVSFRAGTGQTTENTVWPKTLVGGTLSALLGQCPSKGSATVSFGEGAVIDTRFSGTMDSINFNNQAWITVVFDRVGRVGEVLTCGQDPDDPAVTTSSIGIGLPVSTIYLLVARKADVDAGNNTLASDESLWVAIAPQTGRVTVADVVPQPQAIVADILSGADTTSVPNARQNARQGIAAKR